MGVRFLPSTVSMHWEAYAPCLPPARESNHSFTTMFDKTGGALRAAPSTLPWRADRRLTYPEAGPGVLRRDNGLAFCQRGPRLALRGHLATEPARCKGVIRLGALRSRTRLLSRLCAFHGRRRSLRNVSPLVRRPAGRPSSISRSYRQRSGGTGVTDQPKSRQGSGEAETSSVTRSTTRV
jgi:hypothetical protein